jgi:hypothetical protein
MTALIATFLAVSDPVAGFVPVFSEILSIADGLEAETTDTVVPVLNVTLDPTAATGIESVSVVFATIRLPTAVMLSAGTLESSAVTLSVLSPPSDPSVQLPTVAAPTELLTALPLETDPPPAAMEKITVAPCTGLLSRSVNFTDGGMATGVPASAI